MRYFVYASIAGLAAATAMATTAEARHEIISPQFVSAEAQLETEGSYTFVFDSGIPADLVHDLASRIAHEADVNILHVYSDAVRGFSARMSHADAERLASQTSMIDYYETNGRTAASHAPIVQQTP